MYNTQVLIVTLNKPHMIRYAHIRRFDHDIVCYHVVNESNLVFHGGKKNDRFLSELFQFKPGDQ